MDARRPSPPATHSSPPAHTGPPGTRTGTRTGIRARATAWATLLAGALAGDAQAAPQDPADIERAEELLASAEFAFEKERYADAVKTYALIARRYPDTAAGEVAAERSAPTAYLGSRPLVMRGEPAARIDIALMGDGYRIDQQDAFDDIADDVPPLFHQQETFREYESYFNFHRFQLVSEDDNVDGFGREENTALGGYVVGTIEGHVGVDAKLVEEVLAREPFTDGLAIVFVRAGILGTASPGVATIGGRDAKTVIHEWGHAFGRLGDEYSTKTHERGAVGLRPNVSNTDDPEKVPWAHWIEAGARGVGVYEGAAGQVRGAWKPTASDCVMLDGEFFCEPCREALVLQIYSIVDPIEWTNHPPYPRGHPASLEIADEFTFEVRVMRPETHILEVRWWILPEAEAPQDPRQVDERYRTSSIVESDRRARGKLLPIEAEPLRYDRLRKSGEHTLKVEAKDLEPGRYRVICRARDTTQVRGDRLPWVLRDEYGLLESERAWWITIPERDR